jgi:uncharacterized protein
VRTNLDHLPASKSRELHQVVRLLFDEFGAALKTATQPWKKAGRILKIILYGSYARGDWVEDHVGGYISDYDILIIVNDERLADIVDYWSFAEDRLMRELTITKSISAPVNFIVHSLTDVNMQLERGRPFFVDIVTQGVALYAAEGYPFATPRDLPPDEARAEARGYFEKWFPSAEAFRASSYFLMERGDLNESAFNLHQAVERLYHCTLLLLTLYSPKSHRLNFLRSQAEQVAPALTDAWPRRERFERRCFELLRLAYVNARYSPEYAISLHELEWLHSQVQELQRLVLDVARHRLGEAAH